MKASLSKEEFLIVKESLRRELVKTQNILALLLTKKQKSSKRKRKIIRERKINSGFGDTYILNES